MAEILSVEVWEASTEGYKSIEGVISKNMHEYGVLILPGT
jgi:hypothetical protein